MSPCNPNSVSFPTPTVPSGPPIPGVGRPFALQTPNISPFPPNFPEDLLELFNTLQFLIPPGAIKPQLNPNFGKDVFDGITKMLDQFFPFLMLYKFFLPILNLIICIIEVLCALMNPFALISAINRLFSQCIPEFLNMFPVFALIIMIISLLLLLLQLIEYIINKVVALVQDVMRNINALIVSFQDADSLAVMAAAQKLGTLLCQFQNLFVLFAIFNVIIEIIRDILKLAFSIPPCGSSSNSGCCSPITCPAFVQTQYTNTTGVFQYLNEASVQTTSYAHPSPFVPNTNFVLRNESWQLYDPDQTIAQAFSNIYDAYDIPSNVNPKPVFFPTDSVYTATTPVSKAPYTLDLRVFYNPTSWHLPFTPFTPRPPSTPRFIRFTNCIMEFVPTPNLENWANVNVPHPTGVIYLVGGAGYEDDGTTILHGFASDGVTPIAAQATLENFIHMDGYFVYNDPLLPPIYQVSPLHSTDGYVFSDATYTFKPNLEVLLNKQLVTLGCEPSITLNRAFVNTVMYGSVGLQTTALTNLVNSNTFPDPNAALNCLSAAVSGLRSNLTAAGVAQFQATTMACLNTLQNNTNNTLASLVGIGFNPCLSTLALDPTPQFTNQTITVTVNLNENNGIPLTQGYPASSGAAVAAGITPYITFGKISPFTYDGYQSFTAEISSPIQGSGQIMVAYENQVLCTNTLSADPTVPPTHTLQTLDYQFVFVPAYATPSTGGTEGQPRRDAGDVSRDEEKS